MTTRISTRSLHEAIAAAIASSNQRVLKLQQGISDGRAVRKPSDDPVRAHLSMHFRTQLRANAQYERGLDSALSHLSASESVLTQMQDVVSELATLQVQAADDSTGADGRSAIATRVGQLTELLTELGNARFGGIQLFGGTRTLETPLQVERDRAGNVTSVQYNPQGVDGQMRRQVLPEVSLTINVSVADLFGEGASFFDSLKEFQSALAANDGEKIRTFADPIEQVQERVLTATTTTGTLVTRAEALKTRVQQDQTNYEEGRSRAEDLDVTKAMVDFQSEQVGLQAALAAGSKILNLSLLDYLS